MPSQEGMIAIEGHRACKSCPGECSPGSNSPYCSVCKRRREDPVIRAYNKIKNRAAERGHRFAISKKYFRQFVIETGWLERRGKSKGSLSIDRLDVRKGYVRGNLIVKTLEENSKKWHRVDKILINTTRDGIEVKKDQIWLNKDPRRGGMKIVLSVKNGKALMGSASQPENRKLHRRVSVRRMHVYARGWSLLTTPMESNGTTAH